MSKPLIENINTLNKNISETAIEKETVLEGLQEFINIINENTDVIVESVTDAAEKISEILPDKIGGGSSVNLDDFIAGNVPTVTYDLEVVPDFAFSAKGELTTVNLPEANYIGKFAFSSAGGATSGSGSGSDGEGSDEGSEGDMNFNNKKLVTVNMPKITNIEMSAFEGDENLEITSLPSTLLVIQEKAFKDCPKVQLTNFPENIIYIGDNAFDIQYNLDITTLPESVIYLGSGVTKEQISIYLSQYVDQETGILDFSQVPAQWYQMEISNAILDWGGRFDGINLGTEIIIPDGIVMLANNLFYNAIGEVTTLTIPDSVTSIENKAFHSCRALTTLSIPNSVTSIGDEAFFDCYALTTLTLGNNITSIGEGAFHSCNALTTLTIPDSVTSIGPYAFQICNTLTSLTIGNSVTSIGQYAFGYCYALTTVDMTAFDGTAVPTLEDSNAFYVDPHAEGFKFVFATQEALNAFASATNWSNLAQYFEVQS